MAMPKIPRDIRQLMDKHGVKIVDVRANKHFVLTLQLPDGRVIKETCSQSSSDQRAIKNTEARILRALNSPKETTQ